MSDLREHRAPDIDAPGVALVDSLVQTLGADRVLTSEGDRRFYSQDVFRSGVLPLAVVQPSTVAEVQRCVELCTQAGCAVVPRGGGMSYTDGYLPTRPFSVSFDLQALNAIIDLRPDDMVVTVEAGCTWRKLEEALKPYGLRTPYWGPYSGRNATVGGAMSQNSAFWGAVRAGTASQNILGLQIVTADGGLLGVGAHGGLGEAPVFWRDHGPELTSLFTGDCGAMGLKVRVTLPLERLPAHRGVIAFAFSNAYAALRALSEMGRRRLISEACFFDRGQQEARLTQAKIPLAQVVATGLAVLKQDGPLAALSMAAAGRRYLADVDYSLSLIVEGSTQAEVARQFKALRVIAAGQGGWSTSPLITRVLTADHFPPAKQTLVDHRFLPVHAIVPHSRAEAVYRRVSDLFAARAHSCAQFGVKPGVFSIAVGAGAILIEPTWHWTGAHLESHPRLYDTPEAEFGGHAPNPEAEAFVDGMRTEMMELFLAEGAAHFQLGKTYPFQRSRNPENLALISHLKAVLDPDDLMNPGALGFAR